MSIQEIQDEIVEEFSAYDDWMDKYNYLIELGKELPPIKPQYRTEQYLIDGCSSRVWIHAELDQEGKMIITADSDAIITKGIVALLIRVFSGHTPEEIKDAELTFIDKVGLKENLSPTRANGLLSMIHQIRMYALAYYTKQQSEKKD
ncbi:MAG TPA: SufE family protein [Bacteroidetes bacterium]|nr:SufE family protein [Bacteroidota bacterium]